MLSAALAACGSATHTRANDRLPADYVPVPAGRGADYRLPAISPMVRQRSPVRGLTCGRTGTSRYGIHLELYARRLVVPIPAGIGIAPPQRRHGAYVLGGSCVYPIRTYEPTGVAVVDRPAGRLPPTLGTLFAIWGQPLSRTRLGAFRGPVVAFLGGKRWRGAPERIPLARHAEIVLQVGGAIPPHRTYLFEPGL